MRLRLIFPLILIGLSSCLSKKYPGGEKKYTGVVMSCRADSTTILFETLIKLQKVEQRPGECINCRYLACSRPPDYIDFVMHWPGMFTIDFKGKSYTFLNNARPYHPDIKYGEKGFEIHYDLDYGDLSFDDKKQTITLNSKKYRVTRTYNYSYSLESGELDLQLQK